MKYLKLILAFLLLLAMVLTAVACTKDGNEKHGTTTPTESGQVDHTTEPATDATTDAPTEENTDYDEMDTDNKWTKPY